METKIRVLGQGISQEILGESLADCLEVAYRRYKGQRVELIFLRPIGYIDGEEMFIDPAYLDQGLLREIKAGFD